MGRVKNLTGQKIEMLTILFRKRETVNGRPRTFYYCKCDCGNEKWIRADRITSGQKSCGCLIEKTQFKAKDITGKKFGRLTVLNSLEKRDTQTGCVIWKCECDCGNYVEVSEYLLVKGRVKSCGCLKKEVLIENGKKLGALHVQNKIIEGTNIQVISRTTPKSNNTSGITGISWDSSRNKWAVQIRFKNNYYNLGRYENKEDAIKARKDAEEKLHKNFLREKGLID